MSFTIKYKDRPIIPIILKNGDLELPVVGYVDSGSDITYIPLQIARTIDIKLRSHIETLNTGGGNKVEYKMGHTDMIVKDPRGEEEYLFKNVEVSVPTRARDDELLLGREGFFDKFIVTFNEKEKDIILERIED